MNAFDVLIVVATNVERDAVFAASGHNEKPVHGPKRTYWDLGKLGDATVALVQVQMGSSTVGGSMTTISAAVYDLKPKSVLMCGIAFSTKTETKHPIGTVLVSKQLMQYQVQRVGTNDEKEKAVVPRGDKATASPVLLSRLDAVAALPKWKGAVDCGLLLSGDSLIDNIDFRRELQCREPEAIGGEMEASGLYLVAQEAKFDWCVIKAVCDYADGNKSEKKEHRQTTAAAKAAEFVVTAIRNGGFAAESSQAPTLGSLSRGEERNLSHIAEVDGKRVAVYAALFVLACAILGIWMFRRREAGEADRQLSLELARRCDSNDESACVVFRERTEEKCDKGDLDACVLYSAILDRGLSCSAQLSRSVALLERACAGGSDSGCLQLAGKLESGCGAAPETGRAKALAETLCKRGNPGGCNLLALLAYSNPDHAALDAVVQLLEVTCEKGHAGACSNLAMLLSRQVGSDRDNARAFELLRSACGKNDLTSCVNLGTFYETGRGGAVVDRSKAKELYELGCTKAFVVGCVNLAGLLASESDAGSAQIFELLVRGCNGLAARRARAAPRRV